MESSIESQLPPRPRLQPRGGRGRGAHQDPVAPHHRCRAGAVARPQAEGDLGLCARGRGAARGRLQDGGLAGVREGGVRGRAQHVQRGGVPQVGDLQAGLGTRAQHNRFRHEDRLARQRQDRLLHGGC